MICWNTGAAASAPKMAALRRVDHHDRGQPGVVGRGEPGERRVVLTGVVGRLPGGPGLARHRVARDLRLHAGAASATTCCSMPVTASAVSGDTTWCGRGQRLVVALAVGVDRRGDQPRAGGRMPSLAMVVYTSSICIGGDRDAVADRHRAHAGVGVLRGVERRARRLAREVRARSGGRSRTRRGSASRRSLPSSLGDLDRADVRRLRRGCRRRSSSTSAPRRPRSRCRRR